MRWGVTGAASALDGQHKGFIIGIGLSPGLTSYTQTMECNEESETSDGDDALGWQTDFKIGHASSDFLQICWMRKASWFGMDNDLDETVAVAQGIGGLDFTYSFQPQAPTAFLSEGVGFST